MLRLDAEGQLCEIAWLQRHVACWQFLLVALALSLTETFLKSSQIDLWDASDDSVSFCFSLSGQVSTEERPLQWRVVLFQKSQWVSAAFAMIDKSVVSFLSHGICEVVGIHRAVLIVRSSSPGVRRAPPVDLYTQLVVTRSRSSSPWTVVVFCRCAWVVFARIPSISPAVALPVSLVIACCFLASRCCFLVVVDRGLLCVARRSSRTACASLLAAHCLLTAPPSLLLGRHTFPQAIP